MTADMTPEVGFLGFDLASGPTLAQAPALVLGVPVDGPGARSGAAEAPDAIRRASLDLARQTHVHGHDMGNLRMGADWRPAVQAFVADSMQAGRLPIVLGGAGEVADAVLEAAPEPAVIVASHVLRPGLSGRRVTWLGLNGPQEAPLWDAMTRAAQTWITARQMDEGAMPDLPDQAFLWIDAAVLDTGHAAGATGINPGGLVPDTLVAAISALKGRILGVVVTGAAPARDPRGLTEFTLAASVAEVLADG